MKPKNKILNLTICAATLAFVACNKNEAKKDPEPINENEVITTVKLTLTPTNGGTAITLISKDVDGSGPGAPAVTVSGKLVKHTTYNVVTAFLNETKKPAEEITKEIQEEGDVHQVFYHFTNDFATVAYVDKDKNGKNLGLKATFTRAANAVSSKLTVTLLHELDKAGTGANGDDPTNAGGSTDAKVTFDIGAQ